jgi:hypothetical protein
VNKENLKLYSRATWQVLIKEPAAWVWRERWGIAKVISLTIAFGAGSVLLWQLTLMATGAMLGMPDLLNKPFDDNAPMIIVVLVEWTLLILIGTLAWGLGKDLVYAIKQRAEQLSKPPRKPRRKRTAGSE